MKIRWLISIAGTVEGRDGGVAPGDIMEVPDFNGARYIANGYAEKINGEVEKAVIPELPEETAAFVDDEPPPQANTEGDGADQAVRPGRQGGRPPRTPRSK